MNSNDQLLSINQIYLTQVNLKQAIHNLLVDVSTNPPARTASNSHRSLSLTWSCRTDQTPEKEKLSLSFRKLDLLISRNVNAKLIKKHSQKPKLYFNTTFRAFVTKKSTSVSSVSSSSTSLSNSFTDLVSAENPLIQTSYSSLSSCSSSSDFDRPAASKIDETKAREAETYTDKKNKPSRPAFVLVYDQNNDCLSRKSIIKDHSKQPPNHPNQLPQKEVSFENFAGPLKDMMVLHTEWTQLETIELLNESSCSSKSPVAGAGKSLGSGPSAMGGGLAPGSGGTGGGFGFGITGNKSTGVVVKAITPGGSAQRVSFYYSTLHFFEFFYSFLAINYNTG